MIILLKTSKTRCAWTVYRYFHSAIETAYIRCSKCPPFTRTHACRRFLHSLTAASTTLCCRPLQTSTSRRLSWLKIVDLHLIHTLLHDPPNLVINGVQVRTVGGHNFREMKSAVSRCRSSTILLYIITF